VGQTLATPWDILNMLLGFFDSVDILVDEVIHPKSMDEMRQKW
jgi:hypothetical protein